MIKLNTNENPYPPAPGVVEALKNFETDKLRLYPEPTCKVLVDAIADYYGIRSSQVFTGVGSDDVLAMIFMTFFNSKKPILFPNITYSFSWFLHDRSHLSDCLVCSRSLPWSFH